MTFRKRTRKIEAEQSYLKIPDVTKPPSPDGIVDYTILQLDTDSSRNREIDRIAKMAREGLYRKNLILLRKERNLITAVKHEQSGNYESSIACYERAANLAERLELFDESEIFKDKVKTLKKLRRKSSTPLKKKKKPRSTIQYSKQELENKSILPKGVTIPIFNKEIAQKFKQMRLEPEEDEDDLF